jgi:hypothetical protein
MHGDVSAVVVQKLDFTPVTYTGGNEDREQQGESTGQYSSVGDAVLPLLLIACAYVLVRMFRNHKKFQSVNN